MMKAADRRELIDLQVHSHSPVEISDLTFLDLGI